MYLRVSRGGSVSRPCVIALGPRLPLRSSEGPKRSTPSENASRSKDVDVVQSILDRSPIENVRLAVLEGGQPHYPKVRVCRALRRIRSSARDVDLELCQLLQLGDEFVVESWPSLLVLRATCPCLPKQRATEIARNNIPSYSGRSGASICIVVR
jgi:hypothetical protein